MCGLELTSCEKCDDGLSQVPVSAAASRERGRHDQIGFAVFGLHHGVINCGFVCEISLAAMADLVDQRSPLCFELLGVFLLESVVTTTLGV